MVAACAMTILQYRASIVAVSEVGTFAAVAKVDCNAGIEPLIQYEI